MGKVRNRMRSINKKHSYKLRICAHKTIIHFYKSTNTPKDKHWHITLGGLVGEWDEGLVIKEHRYITKRGFQWIDFDNMSWM